MTVRELALIMKKIVYPTKEEAAKHSVDVDALCREMSNEVLRSIMGECSHVAAKAFDASFRRDHPDALGLANIFMAAIVDELDRRKSQQ
jgi:hypothetical protein